MIGDAGRHREVLVPFARLDPRVEAGKARRPVRSPPGPGRQAHPRSEDFRLEHPNVDPIFAAAAEAGARVHPRRSRGRLLRHDDRRLARATGALRSSSPTPVSPISPGSGGSCRTIPTSTSTPPGGTRRPAGAVRAGSPRADPFRHRRPLYGGRAGVASTLRGARYAGLSGDAIELVMGDSWRRCSPVRGRSTAAPRRARAAAGPSPTEQRISRCSPQSAAPCVRRRPGQPLGLAAAATDNRAEGSGVSSTRGSAGWSRRPGREPMRGSRRSPSRSSLRHAGRRDRGRGLLSQLLRGVGSPKVGMTATNELLERDSELSAIERLSRGSPPGRPACL